MTESAPNGSQTHGRGQAPTPNTVRIDSLAAWDQFFHPVSGHMRIPRADGAYVEHLDIDLRLVNELPFGTRDVQGQIYLPNVCHLTLRGGEFCQDDDARVDCLVEVLEAINPVQVRWLHAKGSVDNTFSLSTHMVHQGIVRAGMEWSNLRQLVVQGKSTVSPPDRGYPCPNLTAPTPFSITPAHTPLPSPGIRMRTFSGLQAMAAVENEKAAAGAGLGSIPTIPSFKAKHPDPAKVHERAERQRLADYALKPRFEYAFGGWAPEQIRWTMEGRYTPAAITSIMTNLFKAFASTFPLASAKTDKDLPSLVAFSHIPLSIITTLQALPEELHLDSDMTAYLQDATFIALPTEGNKYARLFETTDGGADIADRQRLGRRTKAEMLLLAGSVATEIVPLGALTGFTTPEKNKEQSMLSASPSGQSASASASAEMTSPAHSFASLAMTEGTSMSTSASEDGEALTPGMPGSMFLEPGPLLQVGPKSRSGSLDSQAEADTPVDNKPQYNALDMHDHAAVDVSHR